MVLALAFVAALVRVGYLVELWDGPCLAQHRWAESDMSFFDRWARDIVAGDWLSARPRHPVHDWHRDIAARYFAAHPGEAEALARDPHAGGDAARALWNRWLGGAVFHQEPLYPYLVAATYAATGPDPRFVFAWQMLLGTASVVLVAVLARRWFGDLVGALAGALAVLFAPALLYDLVLLRTTTTTFAALGLTLLLDRALAAGRPRAWLGTGLAFGTALLLQTTFLLLLGAALALLVLRAPGRRLPQAAALACGTLLALAPAIARNVAVGVPPFALSSVGPLVFLASNTADYAPEDGFAVGDHVGPIMSATGGEPVAVVRAALATHPGPGSVLSQLWRKVAAAWWWYEAPNNTNFYYYRLHSRVLARLPVTFALVSPLALLGLALAAPVRRRVATGYALVASLLAPLLVFYTLSRFRVSLAMATIPFAALAAVTLVRWAGARRLGRVAAGLAALAVLALWTNRPLPPGRELVRRADWVVPYHTWYGPRMEAYFRRRAWREAVALLDASLRHEPAVVRALLAGTAPRDEEEMRYAAFYGMVHLRLAQALERAGDVARAAREDAVARDLLRAGRLAPPDPATDPILPENQ